MRWWQVAISIGVGASGVAFLFSVLRLFVQ